MINIDMSEAFKTLGSFIAKNWQTIALILVIILFFVTKNDYAALKKSMNVMSESYEEQLMLIQTLHEEELTRRDDAIASYEELIYEINDRHSKNLEDILRKKDKDIEENIADFVENPSRLAIEINELFGFEYVE